MLLIRITTRSGSKAGAEAEAFNRTGVAASRPRQSYRRSPPWNRSVRWFRKQTRRASEQDCAEASLVFVYSSQGGQWPGMGRVFYDTEPTFRDLVNACDGELGPLLGWSLVKELLAGPAVYTLHERQDRVQPAVTALQGALMGMLAER